MSADQRSSGGLDALRPCPFCGEDQPSLNAPSKWHRYGSINCPACLVNLPGATSDQAELIECWNARASSPAPQIAGADTVEETLALIQAYVAAVGRNVMNCNLRPERDAAWQKVVVAVSGLAGPSTDRGGK